MPDNEPSNAVVQARLRKWVKVYSPKNNVVFEGILLDDAELERLAAWLHEHNCASWIVDEDKAFKRAEKQAARLEYCVECAELAASLLSECPYIDMSRPDQMLFTDEGMNGRPRSDSIPNNKVPVAIDDRRSRSMGI